MGVQDVPEEAGRRLLGSGPTMTALPFKWFCAGRCDGHCGWGGGRGDDCGARRFVAGGRIGAVALYRGFEDRWCAALTRCDRSLRGRGYSVVPTVTATCLTVATKARRRLSTACQRRGRPVRRSATECACCETRLHRRG